jgi:hypothetical protein
VCVDSSRVCFERRPHLRMDHGAQGKKPVDGDGIGRDTEREKGERDEAGETHDARTRGQAPARLLR